MAETLPITLDDVSIHNTLPSPTEWDLPRNIALPKNSDFLAMPEEMEKIPDWIRIPFSRFIRLKQRNWPAKTVRRSTRQIFFRMSKMITFFIQNYQWSSWEQLSPRWIEDYIDARLREKKAPGTINWDLINLRVFCQFLIDEGCPVPISILKMKLLDVPRRLPRPLSGKQVHLLEKSIQHAVNTAKTDRKLVLAVRDQICFYLLWHCGMRISEVCSLSLLDVDFGARKIFVRNSKEQKDRMAYISDTVAFTLQQYLAIREQKNAIPLFPTKGGKNMTTRALQRRLVHYGQLCNVPVTAHRHRHTFASQMLAAGMPVTSLQRLLGHVHLDTTMIYAEVSAPLLRRDYYRGISTMDSNSEKFSKNNLQSFEEDTLRELVRELKSKELPPFRRDQILDQLTQLLAEDD